MGVNIHLKVQLTVTPKKVKALTRDTKWHSKFQPNMISTFGAILAWKLDDAADDDTDDDRKSDPYMSPSYAGDTKRNGKDIEVGIYKSFALLLEKWGDFGSVKYSVL